MNPEDAKKWQQAMTSVSNSYHPAYDIPDLSKTVEYAIKGEMLTVTKTMTDDQMYGLKPEDIKLMMLKDLAQEMLKSGMIEFTSQMDPMNNNKIFRARAFVTPNSHVQIIRTKANSFSSDSSLLYK